MWESNRKEMKCTEGSKLLEQQPQPKHYAGRSTTENPSTPKQSMPGQHHPGEDDKQKRKENSAKELIRKSRAGRAPAHVSAGRHYGWPVLTEAA